MVHQNINNSSHNAFNTPIYIRKLHGHTYGVLGLEAYDLGPRRKGEIEWRVLPSTI
jgi:hypothetical protein